MHAAETNRSTKSDQALLEEARDGSYASFEEIVLRFRDRVYRLARGMVGTASEAEEVVQETFLNIFRGLKSFRGGATVGTWIYRVAANAALMRLRRQRRKPHLSLEEERPDFADHGERLTAEPGRWAKQPDEKLLDQELGGHIEAAIGRLPEKYRLVLLLRDVEGLSNEEVADTLGLTVPTVKSRLHRSRLIVRGELEDYFRRR